MPPTEQLRWISARHLQHFLAQAQSVGIRIEDWLSEAGINASELKNAESVVPISAFETLLTTLSKHQALPLIGLHLASEIKPATLGPLGLIAQACSTFGDVLRTAEHFNGLLSNIGRLSLQRHPGTVEVCWECLAGSEVFQRQAREYVMGALVVLARFLLPDERDQLICVNFPHARPEDSAHNRGYFTFFRCPVYFDKPTASLVIPARLMDVQMPHGDAFIKHLIEQHAERTLRERQVEYSQLEEVRHLIRGMIIDGMPTKEMVATQLGISGRTLQRRLDEEGTSYRAQLHAVRLELTCEYLGDGRMPVETLAERMGFSSRQAFLRWFRQSTGKTPTQYRKEQACHRPTN